MSETVWTYVYLIAHTDTDGSYMPPVKVGISRNWQTRAKSIQTSSPRPVKPIFCFALPTRELARAIERDIHKSFGEHKTHGEWFDVPPILALVYAAKVVEHHLAKDFGTENLPQEVMEKSGLSMAFEHIDLCTEELHALSVAAAKGLTIQ